MYYGGKSSRGGAIGLATSADGLIWEKHDDPATTEARLADSDPVLAGGTGWDRGGVDRPRVQHTPDGWVMIFQGGAAENRGLALSDDGVRWETHPDNPILTPANYPIARAKTWDTNLVYHDGAYHYFMEIGSLSGTDLYLAVHEGGLREGGE